MMIIIINTVIMRIFIVSVSGAVDANGTIASFAFTGIVMMMTADAAAGHDNNNLLW